MALQCLCFRPTISLHKTILNCIAYLWVGIVIHKLLSLWRVHIKLTMSPAHHFLNGDCTAFSTSVFNHTCFISQTNRLLKTVITYHLNRFHFQFQPFHIKLILLFSHDRWWVNLTNLRYGRETPISKKTTPKYLLIQSSSGHRLCILYIKPNKGKIWQLY